MRVALLTIAAAAALFGAAYEANIDRQDGQRMHAMQVCVRAEHDHRVVIRTFDLNKCVDWNTVNNEDDDN